jgi:hypothetical protein
MGSLLLLVCSDFLLGDVGRKKKIKSDRSLEIYSTRGRHITIGLEPHERRGHDEVGAQERCEEAFYGAAWEHFSRRRKSRDGDGGGVSIVFEASRYSESHEFDT